MCRITLITICVSIICLSVEVVGRGGHGGGYGGGGHSYGHGRGRSHVTSHGSGYQAQHITHTTAGLKGRSFAYKVKSFFVTPKSHHSYYNYRPPPRLTYKCYSCATPSTFPVYHSSPPIYVYRYRVSDNRYSDLLTGLALYNLGRSVESHKYSHTHYTPQQQEKCSMQIMDKISFEETRIPCYMLSTFVNNSNVQEQNETSIDISAQQIDNVTQWLNATGDLLDVTPQMRCALWHNTTFNKESFNVTCALLQKYADTLTPPGVPISVWLPLTIMFAGVLLCCCQICQGKKTKESEPLNTSTYTLYSR